MFVVKILSVDDVLLIRKLIRRVVEALGGELLEAPDGKDAMMILEVNYKEIDLIILDWNMPSMNGFDFLKAVKSNARFKHIPIIMATTENEKEKIIRAIQAGASNYLSKPFTEQELAKKILDCLGLGYERFFNRCLCAAVRDSMATITGSSKVLEMENPGGDEEGTGYYWGQIFIFGQINAIAYLAMSQETSLKIVSLITNKNFSDLPVEQIIDGINELLNMIVAKVKTLFAGSGVQLNIVNSFILQGTLKESKGILREKRIFNLLTKYKAGEGEIFLKIFYI